VLHAVTRTFSICVLVCDFNVHQNYTPKTEGVLHQV
jgi:hypothetical protein